MDTMSLTAQQAMDALRVPVEEQAKYAQNAVKQREKEETGWVTEENVI